MGHTIVLAHGVLGFGSPSGLPSPVNYFNRVAAHLKGLGHRVLVPQVDPIGTIDKRGGQLADFIHRERNGERVHIIAHSMGGLDARHAIKKVFDSPDPVATLITIGTPHRGSPVADAIENKADTLFEFIPPFMSAVLELRKKAGALHDLTTTGGSQFDEATPDVEGVRYIQVAGNASVGNEELILFKLAAAIGRLKEKINDGVVTRSSALRLPPDGVKVNHENQDDWPGDHASEVGWTKPRLVKSLLETLRIQTPPHLARYEKLVGMLH